LAGDFALAIDAEDALPTGGQVVTDLSIFCAATEINDPSARAAYLDKACAGDAALRRHVESLLAAHERSGDFLDMPAGEQLAGTPLSHGERLAPPPGVADDQRIPSVKRAYSDPDVTSTEQSDDGDEIELGFLQPASKPGSLGRLGHYDVLAVLGRGGFGVVLKAFDETLHRIVAIKVMAPHLATTSPPRKRFLREARASAAIRDENIIQIYAVEEQPIPYLVMEYVAGETLQQRLNRTGPLDLPEVLRLGRQIAAGIAAAHAQGLIHRDIKPSNILLEFGDLERVKITDFGLARTADDASLTQSGVIVGTPLYMSPEQAQGVAVDQRADLFSLGSVLYVMCTGRPPFRGSTTLAVIKRVAEDKPRPIREIIPETPEWLCEIIARLHAKKPEERFASACEVVDLLTDCSEELQATGRVQESIASLMPACVVLCADQQVKPLSTEPRVSRRLANEWLAGQLLQARDGAHFAPTPSHFGFELSLGRAYQIGNLLHQRLKSRGFQSVGRKIGFTNRAMWERFNVSEPIWAHMYEQTLTVAQLGQARISLAGTVAPRLEPEVVLKLRRPIPTGNPSPEVLAECIEWVAIGFEVVDSHYSEWRFNAAEALADFGVHAAMIVGEPWSVDSENPQHVARVLETLKVTLRGGKEFVAEGEGRNALGSPLLALGFLARVLATQSWASQLTPGEIITTGTLTALPTLCRGESYCVEVTGAPLAPLHLELSE
jgi:2-keto-4-pentenoate hydratase